MKKNKGSALIDRRYRARKTMFACAVSLALAAPGCSAGQKEDSSTGQSAGSKGWTMVQSIMLQDIQGLYGGQAIEISEDGTAIARVVGRIEGKSGLQEKRYEFMLTGKQMKVLEELIFKHRFFEIVIPERPGVPDEAHPTISVVLKDGKSKSQMKWINDDHEDFDAIYGYLLKLVKDSQKRKPVHEGPYMYK